MGGFVGDGLDVSVTVNILYSPGTNCQHETANAFRRVGAEPSILLLSDLLAGRARLQDADIACLPGGFAFGDHSGAGNVAGCYLRTELREQLRAIAAKPTICICNGFQIAVRAGMFGAVSLAVNASGTFHDEPRQAHRVVESNDSFWLDGLRGDTLHFPCAHGEGRFVFDNRDGWSPAFVYPDDANPDGSSEGIAGITTPDGLALGLMNHPERGLRSAGVLELFANGVRAAR
jgi:phosphoribosylformylglycinamidine (FGAM) synthase-like amidotransferase family enzyme